MSRILGGGDFNSLALEVFRFQAQYNATYSRYLKLLGVELESVKALEQIPFLPVEAFKSISNCQASIASIYLIERFI